MWHPPQRSQAPQVEKLRPGWEEHGARLTEYKWITHGQWREVLRSLMVFFFLLLDSWNYPSDRQLHQQLLSAEGSISPPVCPGTALSQGSGAPSQGHGQPAPSVQQQTYQRPHLTLKLLSLNLHSFSTAWLHPLQISVYTPPTWCIHQHSRL